ncbi:MAG: septation protein SpoVG family protein [Elusimicrobia bacterium]|nr:septation protein SpoVG family protein [Elusimicrobiota bacterium]
MAKTAALPSLKSKVRLFNEVRGNREILGFADLTIGGSFVIKGICIVRSLKDGAPGDPFVSFPSRKAKGDGEARYFDVAHPITTEAHAEASEEILRAYHTAAQPGARGMI